MKRFLHFPKSTLSGILLSLSAISFGQSLPGFSSVGGTQITNTNGQWVTVNPAQPNNIDLIESRIFKLPQQGSGIVGVEFKLAGADGGTARFQWGANDKYSKGGGGGLVQFTIPVDVNNHGRPFLVTLGKKGESKTIHSGFYVSAGGGGSTGMAWLAPYANSYQLNSNHFIAAAGGGSGAFSYVFGTLNGNSAIRNAQTAGGSASWSDNATAHLHCTKNGQSVLWLISGGSSLQTIYDLPAYCCTNELKYKVASSLIYTKLERQMGIGTGMLQSVTYGQKGGQPTTVFVAANGTPNYSGIGFGMSNDSYELIQLGGKGGAGFSGGGAGSSTTTFGLTSLNADDYPTGGAGGTGALWRTSFGRRFPAAGDDGWNDYHPALAASVTSKLQTFDPQNGYMMYRTIADTEHPTINLTHATVYLKDETGVTNPLGYNPWVSVAQAFQPYMMQANGFMDNDGIASIQVYDMNSNPITGFNCSSVGNDIPIIITLRDFAGNSITTSILVSVVDPFKPIKFGNDGITNIDVTTGPVTLTSAYFPTNYDGCKGDSPDNGVTVNFPATTFYCNDAGSRMVQYHFTDSDGNNSQAFTKTFNITCTEANSSNQRILYVDNTANGANDGSSWANAFISLQDALNSPLPASFIYVAKGTYKPTTTGDRTAKFELQDNIKIYGGFPNGGSSFANRNPETNPTILSGELGNFGAADNSRNVVTITGNNVHLEGFTIRDRYDDLQTGATIDQMDVSLGTPHKTTIRNVKFINNSSIFAGGAVYTIYRNSNTPNYLSFENCLFENNSSTGRGGAVSLNNPTVVNNVNTHQSFVNCVFKDNSAQGQGGALFTAGNDDVKIVNCTFGGNTAVTGGGAIFNEATVKLHNSILYYNSSTSGANEIANTGTGTFEADYSNIQGSGGSSGWTLGGIQNLGNNIDANPLFVVSTTLRIAAQSPCRNAGKNDYNTEVYDIYGNNYRVIQDVIDMGAFEVDNLLYVAGDAPTGGGGKSWATAFNNLNDAITAAGIGADQKDIWVKAGVYHPDRVSSNSPVTLNNRENTFSINHSLKIYGGFAGTETSTAQRNIGQNPTILSGDLGTLNNASDNSYHVVTMNAGAARLDGFIIEGGNANGSGNQSNGGGIIEYAYYTGGLNEVVNCVFRNNQAAGNGGAWYAEVGIPNNACTTNFAQTLFYGNSASRGAAVYAAITGGSPGRTYNQNLYNITAYGNSSSASEAGAFEGYQNANNFVNIKFYNSLLAGNSPLNYSDVTNLGNITLTSTYAPASATNVFANVSNIVGADGKIMTADDGLQLSVLSSAIGFGDNALLYNNFLDKDIANQARIINTIDAGAYESPYNAPLTADSQGVIYVRTTALGDGTGSSWENATNDLHNAIHANGVQKVFVAIGNYNVGEHSFIMKNGVEIYGGFDPGNNIRTLNDQRIMPDPGNNSQESTVLNGQMVRPVIWNIFNAATAMDNTAVLDGFMLINGRYTNGGGVRNVYASPTFRNVVIFQNRATIAGGGMYNQNSSPVLTNVIINNNGIDVLLNPNGGQNIMGGGIYNTDNSNPVLTNVTIVANFLRSSDTQMVGVGISNNNSSPIIKNSIFWENRKGYNITMAGVDIENTGTVNLTLKNTITQGYDTGNSADENKINVNPNFENIGAKNFRLLVNSPAIDAGNNTLLQGLDGNSVDLAGNPRVFDFANNRNIDMGAYEYECIPIDYSGVAIEDQTLTYDGNPHSIVAQNLVQDVAVTYEITDSNNQTTSGNTATNAGIYTITATVTPLVLGVDCEQVVKIATLTINKVESIITADETQNFVYDGNVKNVVATLNHTEAALAYSPQQAYTDAGVYPITVFVPETTNYLAASKEVYLVIENADFNNISLDDAVFAFDGTPKSLSITGTLPAGATVVYNGNGKTSTGVYTVNAFIQGANYNEVWLTATMTIEGVDIVPDAGIVYVKPGGSGTKDGSSWVNATPDFQGAINAATQVLVAVGNYDIPTPNSFVMREGVKIYGGFNPVDDMTHWDTRTLPNKDMGDGSVLNGKNESPPIWNHNNGLTSAAVLDGFTLMNGAADLTGGIYNYNVSPSYNNLVIRNNTATIGGGGMYNNSAPITLTNSVIKDNTAEYGGGIRNNDSNSKLTNVIISGNSATMSTTGAGGGGIFNQASAMELTNVLIADNSTNFKGGGFRNLSGNPVFTNVTMANNTAADATAEAMEIEAGNPEINNAIIYGTVLGSYDSQYSLIEGNTDLTNGNLDAGILAPDDVFTDPSSGDYTLKDSSAAIDAGSNALFAGLGANTKDLAGNPRLQNGIIDLGAFEFGFPCYRLANTTGTGAETKIGITLLEGAGINNQRNWPMVRKSGFIALESNTKGFVVSRLSTVDLVNISQPQEGMMVYDTTANCLKIFSDGEWKCFNSPACP